MNHVIAKTALKIKDDTMRRRTPVIISGKYVTIK